MADEISPKGHVRQASWRYAHLRRFAESGQVRQANTQHTSVKIVERGAHAR